jgi:probable rRNA maturation factor|tara:strand:+ start:5555 stop:5995 length:441 start_codon:yes stop_codon:yes gene_type:complete
VKEMIEFINKPEILNRKILTKWLLDNATQFNVTVERLSYFFVTKKRIHELNKTFLNHDFPTDILTFPYKSGESIVAEVFISKDHAEENALNYSQTLENELIRLISHGFLHMTGFSDKTANEKKEMTKKEDEMIKMFHVEQKLQNDV